MKHRSSIQLTPGPAFTLVELLVTMAVFALLIVAVAQLVSSASVVTKLSQKHMDADSQARLVFDRMAGDIAKIVKRPDVDYYFQKKSGNDAMFFYSEAPAFFRTLNAATDADSVGLIGYRINPAFQLERLGKQLSWTGSAAESLPGSMVFSSVPADGSRLDEVWGQTLADGSTDSDYHVLSESVCRMEICFQKTNGEYVGPSLTRSLNGYSAIVVALVILDPQSQQITTPSAVAAAFDDPTNDDLSGNSPMLIAGKWNAKLEAGLSGIPPAAASQIRIYQRHFYLNTK